MGYFIRLCMSALWVGGCGIASAQTADVGLVNLVSGDVSYTPATGSGGHVKPFMRVRYGDRFSLPPGAQLGVVYFAEARHERWAGPANFRAGRAGGEPIAGKPVEVAKLPTAASARIASVPDLIQNARLGGLQVRGSPTRPSPANVPALSLDQARATYDQMRAQMPADDITPELFLYAALNERGRYVEMSQVAEQMLRKQPGNAELQSLAAWAKRQAGR